MASDDKGTLPTVREALMAFKCINGFAPPYLSQKFCKRHRISGRSTRQSNDIQIPKFRPTPGQRSGQNRTDSPIVPSTHGTLLVPLSNNLRPFIILNCLKKQLLEFFLDLD